MDLCTPAFSLKDVSEAKTAAIHMYIPNLFHTDLDSPNLWHPDLYSLDTHFPSDCTKGWRGDTILFFPMRCPPEDNHDQADVL